MLIFDLMVNQKMCSTIDGGEKLLIKDSFLCRLADSSHQVQISSRACINNCRKHIL